MSYSRFKKGDRVVCVFSKTSDDKGRLGFARVGRVVNKVDEPYEGSEYVVDFGRGFNGWYDMDPKKSTYWYVSEDELGFAPSKRSVK